MPAAAGWPPQVVRVGRPENTRPELMQYSVEEMAAAELGVDRRDLCRGGAGCGVPGLQDGLASGPSLVLRVLVTCRLVD